MNVVSVYLPKVKMFFIGVANDLEPPTLGKIGAAYKLPEFIQLYGETPTYKILKRSLSISHALQEVQNILSNLHDTSRCLNMPETQWPYNFKQFYVIKATFNHLSGTRILILKDTTILNHKEVGVSQEDLSGIVGGNVVGSYCTLEEAEVKAKKIITRKTRKKQWK